MAVISPQCSYSGIQCMRSFLTLSDPQSFFTDEDMSIFKKMKLYVEDNWNKCDMVAISLFVVGLSCRYYDQIVLLNESH